MVMAAMSSHSSPHSLKRRSKGCARQCERYCWAIVTHIPLAFVYGLTSWAVLVECNIASLWSASSRVGRCYFSVSLLNLLADSLWARICVYVRRSLLVHPAKLVIHDSSIYRPRFANRVTANQCWLFPSSYPRTLSTTGPSLLYCQVHWRCALLQEMSSSEARSCSSLLKLQTMCPENGPPLSLASDMCRILEL